MTKPSWHDFGTHDESIVPELWDGVIGAWAPCLGPTGSRLHDHSRRANWGTLTNMDNATDWVVSDGQYALDFDGTDDHILTGFPQVSLGRQLTISGWANVSSFAARRPIIAIGSGGTGFAALQMQSIPAQAFTFELWDASSLNPGLDFATASANQWYHVAGVLRQGQMSLFVDGRLVATRNDATTQAFVMPTQSQAAIGFIRGYSFYMLGQIDDCFAWSRSLVDNEIRQLYQLGRGGMYQRRRRSRIYVPQAGFQAAWVRRQNQIIGGGL